MCISESLSISNEQQSKTGSSCPQYSFKFHVVIRSETIKSTDKHPELEALQLLTPTPPSPPQHTHTQPLMIRAIQNGGLRLEARIQEGHL